MKLNFVPRLVAVLLFIIAVSSCTHRSYIYSPSLNLAEKQMEAGQISVGLNAALLPETSPGIATNERWVAPGACVNVKLGLTDNLEIRAETWADLTATDPFLRGTTAFSLVYKLNTELDDWDFFVIPKYGFVSSFYYPKSAVYDYAGIKGHGFSFSLAARMNTKGKIKPYFGLSGLMGFADWQASKEVNPNGVQRNKNGQAVVIHGGASMKLNDYLSFNAEIPFIFQFDQFNEQYYIFPTVSVGLSASLGNLWNR